MNTSKLFIPFLFTILIMASLMLTFSKKKPKEEINTQENVEVVKDTTVIDSVEYVNHWVLNDIIEEDYNYATANFDKFVFYQVSAKLNKNISEPTPMGGYTCIEVVSTIQANMKCIYIIHNLTNNFHSVNIEEDLYLGAFPIKNIKFGISVNDAILILKENIVDVPDTDEVLIKIPATKKYYANPLYIFKDSENIYGIDVINGNVYNLM